MPRYHLSALGDVEFERLAQSLLKAVIGPGTTLFLAGHRTAKKPSWPGFRTLAT